MDLGCYGNKFNETPNIDRLAAEGMRFTQFYAAAPVCSPTRASILTGQSPARLGLTAHIPGHWKPFERLAEPPIALALPKNIETVATTLRGAGYATAHFGKWHLGGTGSGPTEHGFETSAIYNSHTVPSSLLGKGANGPRRTAEVLTEQAVKFMRSNRERPFFLYLCHFAVHIPLDTTPELQHKYEQKPKVSGYSCHPLYAGLLEEMDTSVGAVMRELTSSGVHTNTIVIFMSDNGGLEREVGGWPGTRNDPLRGEKGSLYEGGLRVPFILSWPGVVPAKSTTSAMCSSVDFFPTVLDIIDKSPPSDLVLDGISLLPLLRNEKQTLSRDTLYWHYPHYHHSRPSSAIRQGDWKAIEFFDTGKVELYDLSSDSSEAHDLGEKFPDRANSLRSQLDKWRRSVNAQLPQVNPAYDPIRIDEWWSRINIAPTEPPGTLKPSKSKP
jgi:uncharacterized sulfatase